MNPSSGSWTEDHGFTGDGVEVDRIKALSAGVELIDGTKQGAVAEEVDDGTKRESEEAEEHVDEVLIGLGEDDAVALLVDE